MEPRISISVLVDYMLAETAGGRRAVLKSAKSVLGRTYFAPYYAVARKTLRDYHSGNSTALSTEIERLKIALREAKKPQHQALLKNNLRALSDYQHRFGQVSLHHANKRFLGLPVGGIVITCEPTLTGVLSESRKEIPANIIVEFGEEAPIQAGADYTTQLLYKASGASFATDPVGAQLWHPTSGVQWFLDKPRVRTWHNIEAACEEITSRWPGI